MQACLAAAVSANASAVMGEKMLRGQAEFLVPFAQEAIEQCGVSYKDLDAIICTNGPGAFTGLRIALSAARAFSLSLNIPVFGITTLQALAMTYVQTHNKACTVLVETKRKDFYVQSFDEAGQAVSEALALEADEIDVQGVLIGDAVERFCDLSGEGFEKDGGYTLPDLEMIGAMFIKGEHKIFKEDPQPVYLRGADVSLPKKKFRVLKS